MDLLARHSKAKIDSSLITLLDYNFKPCIFCGKCANNSTCPYDKDFNKIFQLIKETDGLFLVVPHYSIIPAKLTIMMEKMNQFYYTAWIKNPKIDFSLKGKKVAIIGHGGSDERSFDHYKTMILGPLNYLFSSLQFNVIGLPEQTPPLGIVFGVTGFNETQESIFPDMVHDWVKTEQILEPLVVNYLSK